MRRRSDVENAEELDKEEKIERRKKFSSQIKVFQRFLTGIIFSHIIYFLLSYTSKWNKQDSFYSGIVGFFVATAMAFSEKICCIILLMIPSFCTAQGRSIFNFHIFLSLNLINSSVFISFYLDDIFIKFIIAILFKQFEQVEMFNYFS